MSKPEEFFRCKCGYIMILLFDDALEIYHCKVCGRVCKKYPNNEQEWSELEKSFPTLSEDEIGYLKTKYAVV